MKYVVVFMDSKNKNSARTKIYECSEKELYERILRDSKRNEDAINIKKVED